MRRIAVRFFLPVLIVGILVPVVSMVVVEPSAGDLTRTGFLPERQFGWRAAQPALFRRTSNSTNSEATVLVIGDSFSGIGLWQQAALGKREKYVTYQFGRLCSDFGGVLRSMHLSPRVVIIEAVERDFDQRFFSTCDRSRLENAAPNAPSADPKTRDRSLIGGMYGAKYVAGSLLYFLYRGEQHRPGPSGGVFVARVSDGCALFSNHDCEYGLFLGDDRNPPVLPLNKFRSPVLRYLRQAGVERIVVVPIPNKTSVYLQPGTLAKLKDDYLAQFGIQNDVEMVPLHQRFAADRYAIKDFYLPNDTHLSPAGMQVLGEYVGAHFK